jgi:4-amino-4-deoxy-L-arabinose transferase-like glycosyltransferase
LPYWRLLTRPKLLLGLLLLGTAAARPLHLFAPLLDGMPLKQVYVAHKVRAITRAPFDLLRNDFDWLDEQGQRHKRAEEAPLYAGLVALAYRVAGEREWIGRAFSMAATLLSITCLYDLVQRTQGRPAAFVAAFFFAACPLVQTYGWAFQPDSWMLASMLATVCCLVRRLDGGGWGWLIGAAIAGGLAGLFKFFGLMVLVPLAWETASRQGWRGWLRPDFLLTTAAAVLPVTLCTVLVFRTQPNPSTGSSYFLLQCPELLGDQRLYLRFFDRFLFKDCGPLMAVFLLAGVGLAIAGRTCARHLGGWSVMGLGFYFLMAPFLLCHEYYELMMLPAAAGWAAMSWKWLYDRRPVFLAQLAATVLLIGVVLSNSPLVRAGSYQQEIGAWRLAKRIRALTPPDARVVVAGWAQGEGVLHYARREGWVLHELPAGPWSAPLEPLQNQGARWVALYLHEELTPPVKREYLRLLQYGRLVEKGERPRVGGERAYAYYILEMPRLHGP